MEIKITPSAVARIAELIAKDKNKQVALRVSVDGGGCSGFMYNYQLVDAINSDDFILADQGVKVAIDPVSQEFLEGCTIEFVQELGSNYFQIINPQATAKCGCGNSFAV